MNSLGLEVSTVETSRRVNMSFFKLLRQAFGNVEIESLDRDILKIETLGHKLCRDVIFQSVEKIDC